MTFWTFFLPATPSHFHYRFFSFPALWKILRRSNTKFMSGKRFKNHRNIVHNNHHILQNENIFFLFGQDCTWISGPSIPFPPERWNCQHLWQDLASNTQLTLWHAVDLQYTWVEKEPTSLWYSTRSNKVGEMLLSQDLRKTLIFTRLELKFIW